MRVDQYVHTFRARDAVSDEARLFRDRLRERGFASSIVAAAVEGEAGEVERFDRHRPIVADAVLYHHATVPGIGQRLARWDGRSALLYHGVTPPDLVRPYQPYLAAVLAEGRAALVSMGAKFRLRYADSAFGAAELRALGGGVAAVLPFCLDVRRFGTATASTAANRRPGETRWLSVGRIAPNKGVLDLVAAFAASSACEPGATLTLVGAYSPTDPYYWAVRRAIDAAGVYGRVRLAGSVDDAALVRCYEAADVYVCLSEHEGFCVPLVEAMRFDLPIVALARGAVPETLGGSGVLSGIADPSAIAALVRALASDPARRAAVIETQRRRRLAFEPESALRAFDRAIDALLAS